MSRISPGTVIVGIFAVLFGLVGAYAVRNSLTTTPAAASTPPPLTTVPIASLDLEPGRRITMGDIAIMRLTNEQLREQGLPDGYMTIPQQIIGRTLKDRQAKGQAFYTDQLYPEGMGPTISDRLKPGLRAVTIEIANEAAVAGLAPPGSFVDIFFRTTKAKTPDLPETTITLLENVEVLALGPNVTPGVPSATAQAFAGNVTVAVTPEQASALKVVEGRGELMLALRSPDDPTLPTDAGPETLESLLGVVVEPPVAPTQTTIFRGVSSQTVSFANEQATSPIRITARPIRAHHADTAGKEDNRLQPATLIQPTTGESSKEVSDTTAPTSSLEANDAVKIVANTQVPGTSIPQKASPSATTPATTLPATAAPVVTTTPTAAAPATSAPATSAPATSAPATSAPATSAPATAAPVTAAPVTAAPVTAAPVTAAPVTAAPVTATPVTAAPVTATSLSATPVTESATTTPAATAKATQPNDDRKQPLEPFRSVFFSGTQKEELVFENGKLASRILVPPKARTSSESSE